MWPYVTDVLTDAEVSQLSELTFYKVACQTNWTRDLNKCPIIEISDVKKFIMRHSKNFDVIWQILIFKKKKKTSITFSSII